jgi:uncharacterized membrane protein YcaP (DUF421 family)
MLKNGNFIRKNGKKIEITTTWKKEKLNKFSKSSIESSFLQNYNQWS